MNKTFAISFITVVAVFCGSFSSCQDYDPFDYETVHSAALAREFTQNFESRYGKIDPNHDWGFSSLHSVNLSSITRAGSDGNSSGAGSVYVRTNQWAMNNPSPGDEYIEDIVSIPGYPNFDGIYYSNNGSNDGNSENLNFSSDKPAGNWRPCGDVTDYEIQYVSNFFRTTYKPQSVKLHLTDFFVQPISIENDRDSEGNVITTVLGQGCDFSMNKLMFKTMDSHDVVDDTWTHLNNFNRGSQNQMNNNVDYSSTSSSVFYSNDKTNFREIKYVTSSGTEDFAYQSNFSDIANTYFNEWVLVKLNWKETGKDGQIHDREGYYLAFDFEAKKNNTSGGVDIYEPDGYYNNWIIKITPAFASEESVHTRRIMCEDLGNTYDFDFNDVVFDVYYEGGDAVITLQAAGGTLPINVGQTGSKYEAHYLLGQEDRVTGNAVTSIPVNVGSKGVSHEVAIYRIPANGNKNPDNIPVYVETGTNTTIISLLSAENKSSAPQKFCVPVGVRWMQENEQIENGYKYFDSWVSNKDFIDDENRLPWYTNKNVKNETLLTKIDSGVTNGNYSYDHSHGVQTPSENPNNQDSSSKEEQENQTSSSRIIVSLENNSGDITFDKSLFANATTSITFTINVPANKVIQLAVPYATDGINHLNLSQNGNLNNGDNRFVVTDALAIDFFKKGIAKLVINYTDFNLEASMITVTCN